MKDYEQLNGEFDVIVIRHHETINADVIWLEIFKNAVSKLSKGGILLVTSYTDEEHELVKQKLSLLGCSIIVDADNEFARKTRLEGVSIDKKVLVVSKK